jgi:hypothetical protein
MELQDDVIGGNAGSAGSGASVGVGVGVNWSLSRASHPARWLGSDLQHRRMLPTHRCFSIDLFRK